MTTQIDVMNEVMRILGLERLDDPNQATIRAEDTRAALGPAAEACLSEGAWNFAEVIETLARGAAVPTATYDYTYPVPGQHIRTTWISEFGDPDRPLLEYRFRAGVIETSAASVTIAYVSRDYLTKYGLWPQAFGDYVAAEAAFRLAAKLAPSIAKEDRIADLVKRRLASARGQDAVQNPPRRQMAGTWSTARLGRGAGRGEMGR